MVSESLYRLQLVHTAATRVSAIAPNTQCLPRLLQSQEGRPLINSKYICRWKTILLQNSLVMERPPTTTCRNQTHSLYWKLWLSQLTYTAKTGSCVYATWSLKWNYDIVNLPINLFSQVMRWGEATGCVPFSGFLIRAFISLPLFAQCEFILIAILRLTKALNKQIGAKLLFSSAEQIFKYIELRNQEDLIVNMKNIIVSYTAVKGLLNEPAFYSLHLAVAALWCLSCLREAVTERKWWTA